MSESPLQLPTISTSHDDVDLHLAEIRRRMSPEGDVVSPAGRQKTIDVFGEPLSPRQVVETICRDVKEQALAAVADYTARLDGAEINAETMRVPAQRLEEAHRNADPEFLAVVRRVRDNIRQFQEAILHADVEIEPRPGVKLRQRYLPLERVGLCVPGGAAAYPSTVLMTAVPAQAAGVEQLAVVAPPTPFGADNPHVLATCHELGIDEVYRVGGAQAVAMLAFGIENVPAVDKIVGPGNLFVALAKQHVFGHVDIDSIAGPSEVVVVADETTPARFAAADMLAQAEHAPGASILVTSHQPLIEQVAKELNRQLATLSRADLTRQSLAEFAALVITRNDEETAEIVNSLAPEHLHVATENAAEWEPRLTRAGAMFLGPYTPVALGDYAAGPSHVLPTGATARWASGLSANSFLRTTSIIEYEQQALRGEAATVQHLADCEGLTAHRASVDVRLD